MRKKLRVAMFLAVLLLCGSVILSLSKDAVAFTLPDTGQTKCYDTVGTVIACAGTGQDGAYSINPMSYTDNGDGTITDNVTGIMWQKGENSTYSSYNWYQASGTYHATYNSSSQNVCDSMNGWFSLGGHSDWRLPTKKELLSLLVYRIPYRGPAINTSYFPDASPGYYWSSTTYFHNRSYAWYVTFEHGSVEANVKSNAALVRCVRGGQSAPSFSDNGDGTITDNGTGLMWQQGEPGNMTWANALSYCEGLSLGGQTGWRLPNIKELESITDDTIYNPAIDTTYFPDTFASEYWSSTTSMGYQTSAPNMSYAYFVHFADGFSRYNASKTFPAYVRCVQGGQSRPLGNCAATLSDSFLLHEPYFTINGSSLWLDLQYAQDAQFPSTDLMFKLSNAGGVTNLSDYSNCQASALTRTGNIYVLRIPILILGGTSYWLDLTYVPTIDGLLWFKLTNYGGN